MDIKKAFNIGAFIFTTALVSSCDNPKKVEHKETLKYQRFDMKLKAFISNPDEEPVDPAVPAVSSDSALKY
jgi:hypothetical protein